VVLGSRLGGVGKNLGLDAGVMGREGGHVAARYFCWTAY